VTTLVERELPRRVLRQKALGLSMPLTRFLGDTSFGPDEIAVLVAAYKAAMRELDVLGPTAPGAETLAMTIIRLAKQSSSSDFSVDNWQPTRA
jgi:hypothetical protein